MKRSKRLTKRQRKEEHAALLIEINILASMRRQEIAAHLRDEKIRLMQAKIQNFGANYGISAAKMKIMGFGKAAMYQLPQDLKFAEYP